MAFGYCPENDSKFSTITDTNYIADYKNLLTARFFLLYQDAAFVLNPTISQNLVYRPNVSVRVGIAGYYKWFGLGFSLGNPFFRRSTETYGKTSLIDLRMNAYGKFAAFELTFQDYKGFYISSVKSQQGLYYKVPDMRLFSFGIAVYGIFNSGRFSLRAAFIQNERQKKSAGSLMIRPFFMYYKLSSNGSIVPSELQVQLGISNREMITSGTFYAISLAPGYSYTFIFLKNFYVNAAVFPGVYWQHYTFKALAGSSSAMEFSFLLSGRFALGYNADKWFIGAGIVSGFDEIPSRLGKSMFFYNLQQMRFWVGTRFDWFRKKKN